jgi:hypothetical protein
MFTVNFILKNNPNSLTLVFKAHKAAEDLYKKALNSVSKIQEEDDFGLKISIDMSEVVAVTFSEYENDMDKNMDLQIIQHKCQLKGQAKARNDIGLQMMEKAANPIIKSN